MTGQAKKIIIIGGGASGLMAAAHAAEAGARVTVFEKNDAPGKKLAITGKGRCNLTNACNVEDMLANTPGNPQFLYSCMNKFDSWAVIDFFKRLGVATKIERGQRVFPVSDKARDVVAALQNNLARQRVEMRTGSPVEALVLGAGHVKGVKLKSGAVHLADAVLIAAGGMSYPSTGSSGDGYKLAAMAGHSIITPRPSLVPLTAAEHWAGSLEGLTLRNIGISVYAGGKKIHDDFGEMLFTRRGVSGPVILTASRFMSERLYNREKVEIHIDLKPALDEKTLDARLMRDFAAHGSKDFKNVLGELLPKRLIPVVIELSGIQEHKKVNTVIREERARLLSVLKGLKINITGDEGFAQAVVTAGGVKVNEINPSTMESKLVKGLYFSGEVIDVDALTGGFNLQIAFSTGAVAGVNMAGKIY